MGTATSEEEKIGRAAAFGRQSATPTVRRRDVVAAAAANHTTPASYSSGMNYSPRSCSVYSRDVYNLSNPWVLIPPKTQPANKKAQTNSIKIQSS